jgi:acyl-CoA thioester hydrolase
VSALSDDASRWAISHELYRGDGQLSATIEVTGAWIDMVQRTLIAPLPHVAARMHDLPKMAGFAGIDR